MKRTLSILLGRTSHIWTKVPLANWLIDLTLTIPRFIMGMLLALEFGASKFGMPWTPDHRKLDLFEIIYWFPQDVAEYGGLFAAFPEFFAWMAGYAEAVGGILLAVGLLTRWHAVLIIITMAVAILCQKWGQGTWAMLPAMGFLWVAVYTAVLGGGRWSLDYLIHKVVRRNEA